MQTNECVRFHTQPSQVTKVKHFFLTSTPKRLSNLSHIIEIQLIQAAVSRPWCHTQHDHMTKLIHSTSCGLLSSKGFTTRSAVVERILIYLLSRLQFPDDSLAPATANTCNGFDKKLLVRRKTCSIHTHSIDLKVCRRFVLNRHVVAVFQTCYV